MEEIQFIFYILLFLVAFLYASVGHGGASGYLALMALFAFSPEVMRPTALILNIFVSLMAFFQYYRIVDFNWKIFIIIALASVPAAYVGGSIEMDPALYKRILGIILIVPIIKFLGINPKEKQTKNEISWSLVLVIGGVIGFLSGLIGIGGGILLTPVILLLGWMRMKEAAAVSAIFITVNSIAGLLGQASLGLNMDIQMLVLVAIALAGGTLGSFLGAKYFSGNFLKKLLAFVLIIAALKLLLT
jgi:uncharacterized membrane protein YfcA